MGAVRARGATLSGHTQMSHAACHRRALGDAAACARCCRRAEHAQCAPRRRRRYACTRAVALRRAASRTRPRSSRTPDLPVLAGSKPRPNTYAAWLQPAGVPGSPPPPRVGVRDPFVIGVCGGTASGKTTVCDRIMHHLQERRVVLISQARAAKRCAPCVQQRASACTLLCAACVAARAAERAARGAARGAQPRDMHGGGLQSCAAAWLATARCRDAPLTDAHPHACTQDSFYRGLTPEEHTHVSEYNFDHPNAMDQEAILQCLVDLKARKAVEVPIYDFKTHRRVALRAAVAAAACAVGARVRRADACASARAAGWRRRSASCPRMSSSSRASWCASRHAMRGKPAQLPRAPALLTVRPLADAGDGRRAQAAEHEDLCGHGR